MEKKVAPSLLAANFLDLRKEVEMVNSSLADWFHVDVMDGHFVPNISFGFFIIKQIKSIAQKPLDVHLMIENPDDYIHEFKEAGAHNLTVHFETCKHLHRSLDLIRKEGMNAGVVINPHTPIDFLSDTVEFADLVLIMSVNPGFGGQRFIESTYRRISQLKDLLIQKNSKALIEVDGGVDLDNAPKLRDVGVDVLVAGSTVFKSDNPLKTIELLRK